MQKPNNPFRAWLELQPRDVTMASLARDLGVDPSYISDLMSEKNKLMPSLPVAIGIENRTEGKVKAKAIHDFAMRNRAVEAEARAAA